LVSYLLCSSKFEGIVAFILFIVIVFGWCGLITVIFYYEISLQFAFEFRKKGDKIAMYDICK
jgi:hypothetical protein